MSTKLLVLAGLVTAGGGPNDYLWFGHANRVFTSRATTLDIGYTHNAALRPDSMTS